MTETENWSNRIAAGMVVSIPDDKKDIVSVLDKFINQHKALGVYLATSHPHERVIEGLKDTNIDASSLFFLEFGIRKAKEKDNLFVLRDPSDLTELSVVITEVMENEGIEFLIMDEISGLESHVKTEDMKKFLHALITYFKKLGKALIVVYTGTESKELMDFLVHMSDYHREKIDH